MNTKNQKIKNWSLGVIFGLMSKMIVIAGPVFFDDYERGLAYAKVQNKPVIVIFSAHWCGPCQQMKNEVYGSVEVSVFHSSFVWLYLDVDQKKNQKVAQEYGVRGIPHIQFLNVKQQRIDQQVGGMSAQSFAIKLAGVLKKSSS
jgi:thiol:disulfide interchange protein